MNTLCLITGFHYKAHTHSSYANNEIIPGGGAACRMGESGGCAARGIEDGDVIRVFNDRGEIRIEAKVDAAVLYRARLPFLRVCGTTPIWAVIVLTMAATSTH